MYRTTARRMWPALIAGAMLVTVGVAPALRASFFFNNLIPPPTGTNTEKEVDPPPVINPPPVHQTPEPGTMVLAMLGVAGVGAYRKIRKPTV
jgi:hypothetical protein